MNDDLFFELSRSLMVQKTYAVTCREDFLNESYSQFNQKDRGSVRLESAQTLTRSAESLSKADFFCRHFNRRTLLHRIENES